jgi:hypothetical protein
MLTAHRLAMLPHAVLPHAGRASAVLARAGHTYAVLARAGHTCAMLTRDGHARARLARDRHAGLARAVLTGARAARRGWGTRATRGARRAAVR